MPAALQLKHVQYRQLIAIKLVKQSSCAGTVAILQKQAEQAAAVSNGAPASRVGGGQEVPQEALSHAAGAWEAFHARDNATARFYKERR